MQHMLSLAEWAEREGVAAPTARTWAQVGAIRGAIKMANRWFVPERVTADDVRREPVGRPRLARSR